VNRGAGLDLPCEEQGAHALSGGLLHRGHACGMLWGAALSAGARARELYEDVSNAAGAALLASSRLVHRFSSLIGPPDCRDLIGEDLTTVSGQARYVLSGKAKLCAQRAVQWAPAAHETIDSAFSEFEQEAAAHVKNCAVAVFEKLAGMPGLYKEDAALVAGFAGGLGLSGNACGALAAGMSALGLSHYRVRGGGRDSRVRGMLHEMGMVKGFARPSYKLLHNFTRRFTGVLCPEISGRRFGSMEDHARFISEGGCKETVEAVCSLVLS